MSELEYRSAELVDVSFPKRTIEIVVMPYEKPGIVDYHGRMITEVCSRGAYDGIEHRENRQVKVNLHHDVRETCGYAAKFHPSRDEGLVAELLISKTKADVLTMADEGLLDASAGFSLLWDNATGKPYPDAETWETRTRRRLNRLYLGHVALVPEPAYPDARVLAVRNEAKGSMPNRERLEVEALREAALAIDKRYGLAQH